MQVVFTGRAFDQYGMTYTRREMERMCAQAGVTVKGSVTRGVDFLVTNSYVGESSKMQHARRLGVDTILYPRFIDDLRERIRQRQEAGMQPTGRTGVALPERDGGWIAPQPVRATTLDEVAQNVQRNLEEGHTVSPEALRAAREAWPTVVVARPQQASAGDVARKGKRALDI